LPAEFDRCEDEPWDDGLWDDEGDVELFCVGELDCCDEGVLWLFGDVGVEGVVDCASARPAGSNAATAVASR
jgi:hypothetical protein